jgi:integrase
VTAAKRTLTLTSDEPRGPAHRLYPLLHLTANTGMRRGEVVGLKWSDLDHDAQRLSIQRTLQFVGERPVEIGVKTRTSRRT